MPDPRNSNRSSSSRRRSSSGASSRRDRKIRKYIFQVFIAITAVVLIGFGGWYGLRVVRKQHAMAASREFADKKEYLQAALSARRALQISPSDLDANRLMAEMAEAMQTKEAVAWREKVAEMQPGVAQNYLDWADTALRFRDAVSAREALSKLGEVEKNTAAYHDMAARLAVLNGKTSEVYAHVAAAAQLEPQNENYQLQLAAVQLGSPLPEVRKAATAKVERLAESPKIRRSALRILMQSALSEKETQRAIRYTADLMLGPGGTFDDRMLYLKLLGQLKAPQYWWFLAQLGSGLPDNDDDLVTLLSWMNNNGLARLTLMWAADLPNERSERVPVCVGVAEAHALLGNWGKLKTLLRFQKWGELEYQREALTARVAREEGDDGSAHSHWAAAVALAGERPEAVAALQRFARVWNWDDEATGLLWIIANGRGDRSGALQQLLRKYTAEGKTRELLRVFNRMLEIDPQNLTTKNNVAYALLILNMDLERAQMLAYEARNSEPGNPEYTATYALAMNSKGKADAALKVLQQLDEAYQRTPTTALVYGVVLAAKGMKDEARRYLDIADKGALLPEEKTLSEKTRQAIER